MLLNPEGRLKLRSTAAPLNGITTSCRLSQPSPKLSNSCSLTWLVIVSGDGTTDGGGEGSSCKSGGLTGGVEGAGAEGGGEGEVAGQIRAPKAASMKLAARISLRVTRRDSASVSKSLVLCARRATKFSFSSAAVRWVGSCGGCSHNLTTAVATWMQELVWASGAVTLVCDGVAYYERGQFDHMLRHPVGVDLHAPGRCVQHGAGHDKL